MRLDTAERNEAARVGRMILRPDRPYRGQMVLEAGAPIVERHPERLELPLDVAHPDAEHQATVRQDVHGGQLLRQDQWVAQRQDHDPGAEPHRAGSGGQERQRGDRV